MKSFEETFNRALTGEDIDIQCFALEVLMEVYKVEGFVTHEQIQAVIDEGRKSKNNIVNHTGEYTPEKNKESMYQ